MNFITLILIIFIKTVLAYKDPVFSQNRTVLVNLFEWKWTDIANECERYLGPEGFGGILISPPNEHALITNPLNPWWQRYQSVSYKLDSRSGNEQQFKDMVQRCNTVGVRIYVDTVINHMCALNGVGSAGSQFSASQRSYPAVPYTASDFNDRLCLTPSGTIENFNDPVQVRNCRLYNLPDLATGETATRQKIINYFNYLIDIGVAGYRVDAAKYIWPNDLKAIYDGLKNLRTDIFGVNKRPFIHQEIIDIEADIIQSSEYTPLARATEFKYGLQLSNVVRKRNNLKLSYLQNFGTGWGFLDSQDSLVFVDNHDTQRGHGGDQEVLTFRSPKRYTIANSFMLAWPFGVVQVMSSYDFPEAQDWLGPPSFPNGTALDVNINPDGSCTNKWICEHRWNVIRNMVKFRNIANGEPVVNWWDNNENQIAFSRGNKAFIAINNEDSKEMNVQVQTNLPAGQYCDIITGNKVNNSCTGKLVIVNSDGSIRVQLSAYSENPILAIHVNSML